MSLAILDQAELVASGPGSITTSWLVGELLADQEDLTAVERFEQFHAAQHEPLQRPYYSALMPAAEPGPGQQYAFDVGLDRCSGCKACVAACHALNGLDDGEVWREVGLLVGGTRSLPVLQHVTTACHHCLDPACLSACPVGAYEKDPVTGIVRHLDDQCFGCQYCTLACPYDVPRYHPGKGIVRKCDMCGDRLRAGEAPACVQACPHEAIHIRVVSCAETKNRATVGEFLPTAFDPSYTAPTTRYRSSRPRELAELRAADADRIVPAHGHPALVTMLVLTQLAAGGFLVELLLRLAGQGAGAAILVPAVGLGLLGIAASLLHLGRPLYAYRAILGIRHSWLSREVVAFAAFAQLATLCAGLEVLAPAWTAARPALGIMLVGSSAALGLLGVACSVMVYHVVRRPFWRAARSGVKFAGTTLLLGLALALAAAAPSPIVAAALIAVALGKLSFEVSERRSRDQSDPLGQTAWLLRGPLNRTFKLRLVIGVAGDVLLPVSLLVATLFGAPGAAVASGVVALAASLAGEVLERSLFFRAVVSPRMPGGLPS
jgi:Fe-S-cluster-containing dehydrogenase component/DMSO reductase anchor subunit